MSDIYLFDFGNVLGSEAGTMAKSELTVAATGISGKELFALYEKYWNEMKVGKKDFIDYCEEVVRISLKNITVQQLLNLHYETLTLKEKVYDVAKKLKLKGSRVMILSNESKYGLKLKVEKFKLDQVFEKIYCSAEIGLAKPDPEIFKYVIHDLDVDPSTITLIDDWDLNIKTAKDLGINGVLFDTVHQLQKDVI